MDWSLFWGATTAAATIATAISTTLVLWLQRRNKPWPDWMLEGQLERNALQIGGVAKLTARLKLHNIGDGQAFMVMVDGVESSSASFKFGAPKAQAVPPGKALDFSVAVREGDLESAHVRITWLASPTRLGKRWSQLIRIRDFVAFGDGYPRIDLARPNRPRRWRQRQIRKDLARRLEVHAALRAKETASEG